MVCASRGDKDVAHLQSTVAQSGALLTRLKVIETFRDQWELYKKVARQTDIKGLCTTFKDAVFCVAAESAKQFVRQRMFGAGVKRSAEMLIPSTARYYGPAVNF